MSEKQRRFERVRKARQEQLEREQGALALASQALGNAKESLRMAIEDVAAARKKRLELQHSVTVDDWRAHEGWRLELERLVIVAHDRVDAAERDLIAARKQVADASVGVEQIEMILKRTREEENMAANRADQRSSDELAQRARR